MIKMNGSQQTTCNVTAIIDGLEQQVGAATVTIRPDRSLSISIDVYESAKSMTAEERAQMAETFGEYVADEISKAQGLGIPIAYPAK